MGERQNGPLGLHRLDGNLWPGLPAAGFPVREHLPGPLGSRDWHIAKGMVRRHARDSRSSPLRPSVDEFKQALIAMQVSDRLRKHPDRRPVLKLEDSELGFVDETHKMLKPIDELFKKMWDEINRDRNTAHNGRNISIGVASAYRSAEQDASAWDRAYSKYYRRTLPARLATGDEYGPEALKIIFAYMNGKKAPPGFSGHTRGIAADLTTTENGRTWTVNSDYDHQVGWQGTWLYRWLVANAWKHCFYQLKTETWHWEYHKDGPTEQCWGGHVTHRTIRKEK